MKRSKLTIIGALTVLTGGGLASYGLLSTDPNTTPAPVVVDTPGCPPNPADLPPMTLLIPSLGICAPLEAHGQREVRFHGQTVAGLVIPDDPTRLTLNKDGADCTSTEGTLLLAGHVAFHRQPGALARLAELPPGAVAYVRCASGPTTVWRQTQYELSPKESLDKSVYHPTGPRRLVIVTCAGELESDGTYRSNLAQSFKSEGQR